MWINTLDKILRPVLRSQVGSNKFCHLSSAMVRAVQSHRHRLPACRRGRQRSRKGQSSALERVEVPCIQSMLWNMLESQAPLELRTAQPAMRKLQFHPAPAQTQPSATKHTIKNAGILHLPSHALLTICASTNTAPSHLHGSKTT